ncbi:mitochondrial glyco protein [Sistotremastrum niveocremeum HHB9708]|uniref:Mitochondrial glyco protein n=2 Tax=Sistotremastraceae TaxID=3402574 RepID=A0A164XR15_9AGAM|nr:mitochondrial glyco protein [Sistotremastrum niveocremeum HHB9708]KZT35380.1 mitochondrial glyco protein [Sistotremastrum suecicum HHB10207 ss-3]
MSCLRSLQSLRPLSRSILAVRPCAKTISRQAAQLSSAARPAAVRAFSVSTLRRDEGMTDVALASKLKEEIAYEKEASKDAPEVPEFLKSFQEAGVWEISDSPGHDEISLTRKYGKETIRVLFSIADIGAGPEEQEYEEMVDEQGNTMEDAGPLRYPVRASVSITKTGIAGGLTLETSIQDGSVVIDNVSWYRDGKLATDLTAEGDWQRRGLYIGPQYDQLDAGVQGAIEAYLQERGVTDELAAFIEEYGEWKEQKEYVDWLSNVKGFIEG